MKQPLLRSVLPDGTVVMLVVLHDDRCAILRNNETIHQAGGDADGIDGAVQRFMAMTQVTDVLGGGDAAEGEVRAGAVAPTANADGMSGEGGGASAPSPRLTRESNPAAAPQSPPPATTNLTPPAASNT